jgi:NTE family protein
MARSPGVLDQLLADGRLAIDGISGASAGAVNAVMLADGLARRCGGSAPALADFWRAELRRSLSEAQREAIERLFAFVPRHSSPVPWFGALTRYWSPYDLNPLNINPLKSLIERFVDFPRIREDTRRELFISATNVHSGQQRVFSRSEITAEVVMASACLPLLFQAVEIDGVPHWDGGYSGNPSMLAIPARHRDRGRADRADQLRSSATPRRPSARHHDRLQEMTFNASLLSGCVRWRWRNG